MADAARSDVAPIGSRTGCVTPIATIVGSNPRGNRHGDAAPQRCAVTGRTAVLWSGVASQVLRMIELHIEVFFESIGKSLSWRIGPIHVLMTDITDRATSGVELGSMTINAVLVTWKAGTAGIVGSVVTVCATNRGMLTAGMEKF